MRTLQVAIDAKNALSSLEGSELQAQTLALQLAEEKAAAVMKECELAVKEEMQAKEVVKVGCKYAPAVIFLCISCRDPMHVFLHVCMGYWIPRVC